MSADIPPVKKSLASHVVDARAQKHAVLAKRTTDEESAKGRKDVNQQRNAREGPIVYTPEEVAGFQDQFNAARRASDKLRYKLQRANEAGLEVSEDDVHELSRLNAISSQRKAVLDRARQGKPLDRKTRITKADVVSLEQDPEVQELAKLGEYSARQLAEYKRGAGDAAQRLKTRKLELAKATKEREMTEAEKEELADLRHASNVANSMWAGVRRAKPANQRVHVPEESLEDLLMSPELQQMAQSSGYSVRELAEAKRRYLDAEKAAYEFKRKLAEGKAVREATAEEKRELQTLLQAGRRQKQAFLRMGEGKSADYSSGITHFLEDPDIQRIAQLSGFSVEEVAGHKRKYLDARYEYRAAQNLFSAIKKERGTLTSDEENHFVKTDHAYQVQKTAWERMNKGERVEPAVQPPVKLGRLGVAVAALQPSVKVGEIAHPVTHTPEQIAMLEQQHVEALDELLDFQERISALEQSGRPMTREEEDQLDRLRDIYKQRRMAWGNVHQGLAVYSPGADWWPVTYTKREIADYDRLHLNARNKVSDFKRQMAAARQAGHSPTPDDEAHLRALKADFSEKQTMWLRARDGKPLDRLVRKSRGPKTPRSPDTRRPGSQERARQPGSAKEPSSTYTPQQIAILNQQHLEAFDELLDFQDQIFAIERSGRPVTREQEDRLEVLRDVYNQRRAAWSNVRQGLFPSGPTDDGRSVTYTAKEVADYYRQYLDALNRARTFRRRIAAARQVGYSPTPDGSGHLDALLDDLTMKKTIWNRARNGRPLDREVRRSRANTARSVPYPDQEIADYNRLFNDAQNKLRAFQKQIAAARQAGHSPTPDDEAHLRALKDDLNTKKTMWTRVRDGKQIDRDSHKARGLETVRSPEISRPGTTDQASPTIPAKADPATMQQPLQMSGVRRLLATVLSSGRRFFQGVGRQWAGLPWAHYLANPRRKMVQPAELLRAEQALH
ncbi:MAG: hypothetical protein M1826_006551 [Phylliscum demangeonii]|nr:MAG: hypothetical protein M1826_006551 [Phylliscum demangeonii]